MHVTLRSPLQHLDPCSPLKVVKRDLHSSVTWPTPPWSILVRFKSMNIDSPRTIGACRTSEQVPLPQALWLIRKHALQLPLRLLVIQRTLFGSRWLIRRV